MEGRINRRTDWFIDSRIGVLNLRMDARVGIFMTMKIQVVISRAVTPCGDVAVYRGGCDLIEWMVFGLVGLVCRSFGLLSEWLSG
jgi:hypothetical protein